MNEWFIERTSVPTSAWLYGIKDLRADGWNVTVLISADKSHCVGLGYR